MVHWFNIDHQYLDLQNKRLDIDVSARPGIDIIYTICYVHSIPMTLVIGLDVTPDNGNSSQCINLNFMWLLLREFSGTRDTDIPAC